MSRKYVDTVNKFIVPYLEKNGYRLIETRFVEEDHNWFLRLFIDLSDGELEKRIAESKAKETANRENADDNGVGADDAESSAAGTEATAGADAGIDEDMTPGVSINDCVKVSRYLSKWLDKEDFIKEMYTLEVCSRGFL